MITALNPKIWLSLLIIALVAVGGGYWWGVSTERKANEAEQNKILAEALIRVREVEAKSQKEVQEVSKNYEERIKNLNVAAVNIRSELGRLRVKARCSVPTTPTSPSESNGAPQGSTNRDGQSEINLDGVAGKIIELGVELDEANTKIIGLQELIKKYTEEK